MNKVVNSLKTAGADIFTSPVPFYVAGSQDKPYLLEGKIEKAKKWSIKILKIVKE